MFLAHALALAEARSAVAALADAAHTEAASIEYERVLLQLDWLHHGVAPGITPPHQEARDVLFGIAETAIETLGGFGVDLLELELVHDMLLVARESDRS